MSISCTWPPVKARRKVLTATVLAARLQVVYLLSAEPAPGNPGCNAPGNISALTDVATGDGAISIKCLGNYSAMLVVRDGAGAEVTVRNWAFEVLPKDVSMPEYVVFSAPALCVMEGRSTVVCVCSSG